MKALITGAAGTVGTALTAQLQEAGHIVAPWDRAQVPPDRSEAMSRYMQQVQPDVLYHLATDSEPTGRENESWLVNYEWSVTLAQLMEERGGRYIFTSSVMVFSDDAEGPFTVDSQPDATEGYGYAKRQAEAAVLEANPEAIVARLGWQIGHAPGSNNMIDFFHNKMQEEGRIEASRRWYPACSFLEDTAAALVRLAAMPPGLYLIDSNRCWTFYEIATALNHLHGNPWQIVPTDNFVFDQRMLDDRPGMPPLSARLPGLEPAA